MTDRQAISDELASFLESGLSITVGTRNDELQPNVVVAWAARVHDDRAHLIIYMHKEAARTILTNLKAHPEIAVNLDLPTSHRACQVKGVFRSTRPAKAGERATVERQVAAFDQDLGVDRDYPLDGSWVDGVAVCRDRVSRHRNVRADSGTGDRGTASVIPLESLTACFQGLIPSWLSTCSRDGVPNVAILSHVDYVDPRHVALSFQFFNKSKRNIMENPKAMVRVYDPDTMRAYTLKLRFARTETEGPLYESMRLRIEAIASYSGLKGIFKLLGADIYEVLSVERIGYEAGVPEASARPHEPLDARLPFTLKALAEISERIQQAPTLDALLDAILETLEKFFGFRHSMLLLTSEQPDRLEMIASRGYPEGGVGSEVAFGEGIIGVVAEARKPIRISGMLRQMLYANAVAKRAADQGLCRDDRRIPLPGLPEPESQLGIPLIMRDELIGVLCIETDKSYRFHEEDRAYIEVLGGYLAIAIQNALLRERTEEPDERPAAPLAPAVPPAVPQRGAPIKVEYFKSDECILIDGEYLARSVPAKILWKLLYDHHTGGAVEFTNRRLRLDKSLNLPELKDNLESRLILLRRRLEERCPVIRIAQSGRGRFRLELGAEVNLVEQP